MRFVFYTHSLVSDWNHGNAHFLRGILRELIAKGHDAVALEPAGSWSRTHLVASQGQAAEQRFAIDFPGLTSIVYGPDFDHEAALADADVVVVHEWTDPGLAAQIGRIRLKGGTFKLLFHDTHHRAVSANAEIAAFDLSNYDLVLAFGEALRQEYLRAGWGRQVVTWHEAADTALFRPLPEIGKGGDLVWIGNWGDGERSQEIRRFLIEPTKNLGLDAKIHGVRYPDEALQALKAAGLSYGGWVANADVPQVFARYRATVHIPRRPYVESLPGIPTIRVFEALACGIPLVCAPWDDAEHLFRAGTDYLVARDGKEMGAHLTMLLNEPCAAWQVAEAGLATVLARHTCRHRVEELLVHLAAIGLATDLPQSTKREAAE